MSAKVEYTLFDCDREWLDSHDAIVHWHNGHTYIDWRSKSGLRLQANGFSFASAFQRAMDAEAAHR